MDEPRRLERGVVIVLAALLLALALTTLGPWPLFAHAELLESYPAAGQTFQWERPEIVRLEFSQPLQPEGNEIVVANRQFDLMTTGPTIIDANQPHMASATLPALAPGTYSVTWRTLSVDGHPLEGSYNFTILPRERYITIAVAASVMSLMGLLVFFRRAKPDDPDD